MTVRWTVTCRWLDSGSSLHFALMGKVVTSLFGVAKKEVHPKRDGLLFLKETNGLEDLNATVWALRRIYLPGRNVQFIFSPFTGIPFDIVPYIMVVVVVSNHMIVETLLPNRKTSFL